MIAQNRFEMETAGLAQEERVVLRAFLKKSTAHKKSNPERAVRESLELKMALKQTPPRGRLA